MGKVHVYLNYNGTSQQLTEEPVGMATAYGIIEDSHAECVEDLELLMNAFCVRGLRGLFVERKNHGDDYDIVSADTGEILRKIHVNY